MMGSLVLSRNWNRVFSTSLATSKGHSKWQNIKHAKAENDLARSKVIQYYSYRLRLAIRENQNERDPIRNKALAKAIEEAQSMKIPNATIKKAISGNSAEDLKELIYEIISVESSSLIIVGLHRNLNSGQQIMASTLKKHKAIYSQNSLLRQGFYAKKGRFIVKGLESLENAEDMAISCDIEEAEELDQKDRVYQFFCDSLHFAQVKRNLDNYIQENNLTNLEIITAKINYLPSEIITLNKMQTTLFKSLVYKLQDLEGIISVDHNVDFSILDNE